MAKTAIVYVDGFNLYYSIFKPGKDKSPRAPAHLKWIDPHALAQAVLTQYGVIRVEYFTARIKQKYASEGEWHRQDAYLRALEATPRVTVHYGNFQVEPKWRRLAEPIPGVSHSHARVIESREKRSDVSLACAMLRDASRDAADLLVVLSNDSDFHPLMETVHGHFSPDAGVISPASKINGALRRYAKVALTVQLAHLEASQLPDTITHGRREIVRPPEWGMVPVT